MRSSKLQSLLVTPAAIAGVTRPQSFRIADVREIDVARWYTPHRGDPGALGKLYADLAHRMVQT